MRDTRFGLGHQFGGTCCHLWRVFGNEPQDDVSVDPQATHYCSPVRCCPRCFPTSSRMATFPGNGRVAGRAP
jgi:hypothetical protein